MIKTIYKCDLCKYETTEARIDGAPSLIEIHIVAGYYHYANPMSKSPKFQLCHKCAENLGIIIKKREKEKIIIEPKEDLKTRLFDIFNELIEYQERN